MPTNTAMQAAVGTALGVGIVLQFIGLLVVGFVYSDQPKQKDHSTKPGNQAAVLSNLIIIAACTVIWISTSAGCSRSHEGERIRLKRPGLSICTVAITSYTASPTRAGGTTPSAPLSVVSAGVGPLDVRLIGSGVVRTCTPETSPCCAAGSPVRSSRA